MTSLSQIISERENLIYAYMPLGVFRNSGEWPASSHPYSLFLYTSQDPARICEWICYHKLLGISHFYIYSCHQDPAAFYEQLLPFTQGQGALVTYHHYPAPGTMQQAFYHYFHHYGHESQWTMVLDLNEFLCLKSVETVPELFQSQYSEFDCFYFNICEYGHSDFEQIPDGDILLNYTSRADTVSARTRGFIRNQSIPYRQLFQKASSQFKNHYQELDPQLTTCNILGDSLDSYFISLPYSTADYLEMENHAEAILEQGYIAHFGIPSHDFINQQNQQKTFHFISGEIVPDISTSEMLHHYSQSANQVHDDFLQEKWIGLLTTAWEQSILPINFWPLISEHKPALQSTTLHPCTPEEDAARLVSGKITGLAQNLTWLENDPWWMVDLETVHIIHEIQIFNRLDQDIQDAAQFELHVSFNQQQWTLIDKKETASAFGGIDGTPYIWTSEKGIKGRYVKLIIPGTDKLIALDQVQIFGQK